MVFERLKKLVGHLNDALTLIGSAGDPFTKNEIGLSSTKTEKSYQVNPIVAISNPIVIEQLSFMLKIKGLLKR